MAFEMMAHHAFNTREEVAEDEYAYHGEVYWKDETVEYCDKLFESLGADLEDITYIEDPWVGGGNAGPAIEVIYKGSRAGDARLHVHGAGPRRRLRDEGRAHVLLYGHVHRRHRVRARTVDVDESGDGDGVRGRLPRRDRLPQGERGD